MKCILLFAACWWTWSDFERKIAFPTAALEFVDQNVTELDFSLRIDFENRSKFDSTFMMPDFSTLFEMMVIIGILAVEIWSMVIIYIFFIKNNFKIN